MNLSKEKYVQIRQAMCNGARTLKELEEYQVVPEDEEERKQIQHILKSACVCNNVSVADVLEAIAAGDDTFEKVIEKTKATTVCGKCTRLIENIVQNKR